MEKEFQFHQSCDPSVLVQIPGDQRLQVLSHPRNFRIRPKNFPFRGGNASNPPPKHSPFPSEPFLLGWQHPEERGRPKNLQIQGKKNPKFSSRERLQRQLCVPKLWGMEGHIQEISEKGKKRESPGPFGREFPALGEELQVIPSTREAEAWRPRSSRGARSGRVRMNTKRRERDFPAAPARVREEEEEEEENSWESKKIRFSLSPQHLSVQQRVPRRARSEASAGAGPALSLPVRGIPDLSRARRRKALEILTHINYSERERGSRESGREKVWERPSPEREFPRIRESLACTSSVSPHGKTGLFFWGTTPPKNGRKNKKWGGKNLLPPEKKKLQV